MHLKSSNGPIDVLVCPECEEDPPQSPCPSAHLPTDPLTSTPARSHLTPHAHTQEASQPELRFGEDFGPDGVVQIPHSIMDHVIPQHQTTPTIHVSVEPQSSGVLPSQLRDDLDISLSSAADNANDLDELMASYNPQQGYILQENELLSSFESLNPPLHDADFSFALDDATEGIQDLFDLVS